MSSIRVAVVGNCQAPGFADCMRALLPSSTVTVFLLSDARKLAAEERDRLAEELRGHDVVFMQPADGAELGALRISCLRKTVPRLVPFPAISFAGFHPDSLYVDGHEQRLLSPIGQYNSALVAAAFLEGVPEQRVPALFNTYFFARLGYFDRYVQAERFLLKVGAEAEYDLEEPLREWRREGAFMHSHNHPRITVLHTLASMAVRKAGLADKAVLVDPASLEDRLAAGARWPIYPEIANRLGLSTPGSMTFQKPEYRLGPGEARTVSLREFVRGSYASYEAGKLADAPTNERVERGRRVLRAANVRWSRPRSK